MDYSYGYGGVPALAEGSGYVAPLSGWRRT
jgi:hypothetical protein